MRERESEKKKGEQVNPIRIAGWSIVYWGIGYSFMFLLKWILVYLFLGKDEFVGSIQQVNMRIQEGNMWLALKNNIAALFYHRNPEHHPNAGIFSFIFILFLVGIIVLAVRCRSLYLNGMIIMALIPYLRFAVIRNHAQIHYFFTYRAQITTYIVILICIERIWRESMKGRSPTKAKKKREEVK